MNIFIIVVSIFLMLMGLLGNIIPLLPVTPLILLASIIYGLYFGFRTIGTHLYITLALLTLLSFVIDYILIGMGAKKFGASKWGIIGAIVGELIGGRNIEEGMRAGIGAWVGYIGALIARLGISLTMVIIIFITIIKNHFS